MQDHQSVICSCGMKMQKKEHSNHQSNDCVNRNVLCDYCELEVPLSNLDEHVIECGSRTDVCEKCNNRFVLMDLKIHICYECPMCSKSYPNLDHYQLHIYDKHSDI